MPTWKALASVLRIHVIIKAHTGHITIPEVVVRSVAPSQEVRSWTPYSRKESIKLLVENIACNLCTQIIIHIHTGDVFHDVDYSTSEW